MLAPALLADGVSQSVGRPPRTQHPMHHASQPHCAPCLPSSKQTPRSHAWTSRRRSLLQFRRGGLSVHRGTEVVSRFQHLHTRRTQLDFCPLKVLAGKIDSGPSKNCCPLATHMVTDEHSSLLCSPASGIACRIHSSFALLKYLNTVMQQIELICLAEKHNLPCRET